MFRQVNDLVGECLETPLPFVLHDAGGRRLEVEHYNSSLAELSLVPSALLTFAWHPEVAEDVASQLGPNPKYLSQQVAGLKDQQ